MKISICIPQYNRIEYLVRNLEKIANQTYHDIEVVISDDASADATEEVIRNIAVSYRYPIVYYRNNPNLGYDRNMRRSMELATGTYTFLLGNDDTLFDDNDIAFLVNFLQQNNLPDIGFSNYVEDKDHQHIFRRAYTTGILGSGYDVCLKHYRSFSFVAGLIWKRESFNKINSDKFDGSVYSQIYLACKTILNNGVFFMIERPLVLKDLIIEGKTVDSYRSKISRRWSEFKITDSGLPRVMKVAYAALSDSNAIQHRSALKIMNDIYTITYPYWIIDYKKNNAFVAAVGLIVGVRPWKTDIYKKLSYIQKIRINSVYTVMSIAAVLAPSALIYKFKNRLYNYIKRKK